MDTVNLNELRRIHNNDLLIQLIRTISAAYNTSFAEFHSHCESMMIQIIPHFTFTTKRRVKRSKRSTEIRVKHNYVVFMIPKRSFTTF